MYNHTYLFYLNRYIIPINQLKNNNNRWIIIIDDNFFLILGLTGVGVEEYWQ